MKKVRDSNMELLRLLAMFMVLVYHADFLSLGMPNMEDEMSMGQWIDSSLRFFVQSVCVVCVNVFVMLSGWFGIKPKIDRLIAFLFQVTFFTLVSIVANVVFWNHQLCFDDVKNIFMLNDNLWFPKSYLLLYVLSPVLNAFVEKATERQFRFVLIPMVLFQMIYGWITGGVGWFMGGYSCIFFIELYLLARYLRLHVDYKCYGGAKTFFLLFFSGALVISLIWIFGSIKGIDVTRFLNVYTQPFAILGAAVLVLLFSKIDLKNQIINKIAASCFAVYLFHCAPGMLTHFTCIVGCLHKSCVLYLFVFYTFMLIIAVYVAAVLLDQIQIWIWHKFLHLSIYTTFEEKCRTYL